MLGKNLLITVVSVGLLLFALTTMDKPIVEGFWGNVPITTVMAPVAKSSSGRQTALQQGAVLSPTLGSGSFFSTPNFQAVLAPRFSNVNYGANIKYNLADRENLASPCDPLTYGNMATENYVPQQGNLRVNVAPQYRENFENKEGYCTNCGSGGCGGGCPPSCGKGGYGMGHEVAGGYELPPGYANGNYNDLYNSLPSDGVNLGSDFPIGTMSTMDASGNIEQTVTYQRLMFAPLKSRLRSYGDMVRGDLPIVPSTGEWFTPSVRPSLDLQAGAMNVMGGGVEGGNYGKLMDLLLKSNPTRTALGGVDLSRDMVASSINMSGNNRTNLSAGMGDIVSTYGIGATGFA